ncbi:MAG TPA: hypothetical protein VFJ24_11890 [Gaiellales bacterium]|nr:hypothetical protein [Gaiellales bacterium]
MSMDLTAATAALKQHYSPDQINKVVYKTNPLYAMIKKRKDAFGASFELPIIHRDPLGQNAVFATAQTNATNSSSSIKRFSLTPVNDYSLALIDGDVIQRSQGKENTFLELLANEIDGAMRQLVRSVSIAMYHAGFGMRGKVDTNNNGGLGFAQTVLQLSNKGDARNFEVGMVLIVSPDEGTSATRAGSLTIQAIDRAKGTLTMTGNLSAGIAAIAAGDIIFQSGDRNTGASPAKSKLTGMSGWLPDAAPSNGESFFGVDRSVDSRLSGNRFDATGYSTEEALIEAGAQCAAEGGSPDYVFMSPLRLANFAKALSTKVFIDIETETPGVGFRGIEFTNGGSGTIKCMADLNCPDDHAYMVDLSQWELLSAGEPVHMVENDGLTIRAAASADKFEVRLRSIAQLACRAPGWNTVITNLT